MSKFSPLVPLALLLVAPCSTLVQAQEPVSGSPPKVLQIFVESVKPGKGAAHEKVEVGWPQAFRKAKWPSHYLAMTSMTGPSEAWFLTGYDSYASWEADQKHMEQTPSLSRELERLSLRDGELLSGTRGIVAVYREDLSYRPNIKLGEMRYFSVSTISLRPGYDSAFADIRKLVQAGHEKTNMDEHWAMFQVVSGMPGSTYLLFLPMKTLEEADVAVEIHGKPYLDVVGEAGRRQLREFARAGYASVEANLFAFSPKMSYPSEELASSDPAYWKPAAASAPKP
jgi:hypothetical protein